MSDDRAMILFRNFHEMQVGLDKFLLAMSVAVCGYLGQTVKFGRIGVNIETGYLLVTLLFALSAILGVLRLERTRDAAGANMKELELNSMLNRTPGISEEKAKASRKKIDKSLTSQLDRAYRHYWQRNLCMLLGLFGYIALKVGAAYLLPAAIST